MPTSLPYNPPVKKYDFRGMLSIVDRENKTVLEILPQSRDIGYEKRLAVLVELVIDLLNGKSKIEYDRDTESYGVWDLIAPPKLESKSVIAPFPTPPKSSIPTPDSVEVYPDKPFKKRGRPPKRK